MVRQFLTHIGRFARFGLSYAVIIIVAATAHRMALWTPAYVLFGVPVMFGFLGLILLTLAMLINVVVTFLRNGDRAAGAILIVALLMILAVVLVANIDAPTIIYAT